MEITAEELTRLKNALDYMENAITDVVGWANDANTKLQYMHQCKRIHQLATEQIEEIMQRNKR